MYEVGIKIIVGCMIFLCAIGDIKKKKVWIPVIVIGGILSFLLLFVQGKAGWIECLGGGAVGGALLLFSKITGEQIGLGDGVLFCVTGLVLGFWQNISLLLWSLFLTSVMAGFLLVVKKCEKQRKIPFIPFVFAGYMILQFLS